VPEAGLLRDLEAVLFAAGRPVQAEELAVALGATPSDVEAALAEVQAVYPVDGARGFELARVGGGWLLRTNRRSEPVLSAFFSIVEPLRLSAAALETLAIVAYLQPVSRPQIAEIRGVQSESAVQTLLDRDLICEVGRTESPGAALLYATTERFQVIFGLDGLAALPALDGFAAGDDEREQLRRKLGLVIGPE